MTTPPRSTATTSASPDPACVTWASTAPAPPTARTRPAPNSGQTEVVDLNLKGPWTDETDIEPTELYLLGLHADYIQDGRVITQILADPNRALRNPLVTSLGETYKQLNSSVGEFGADTLTASTNAIESTSPNDVRVHHRQPRADPARPAARRAGEHDQDRAVQRRELGHPHLRRGHADRPGEAHHRRGEGSGGPQLGRFGEDPGTPGATSGRPRVPCPQPWSYLPRTAAGGFQGPSVISRRTYSITASMILFACRRVLAAATSRAPSPMIEVRMLA